MALANKIQDFNNTVEVMHQIVHGDAQTVVQTDSGPISSIAKVISDSQKIIDENAASQLNPDWSEDDPKKKTYIRNKPPLAKIPADVGLSRVNNTSDQEKPVSWPQAAADEAVLAEAKAYAEHLVVGLWDDRGNYNAGSNIFPANGGSGAGGMVLKGDVWTINGPGSLGGVQVTLRQTVRALNDAPGQDATKWAIALANTDLDDAITSGVTGRAPSQRAVFDALAQKANKSDVGYQIGDMVTTARTLPTPDWLLCDGQAYLQSSYPALHAVIGSPLALTNSPTPATSQKTIAATMSAFTPDGSILALAWGFIVFILTRSGDVFSEQIELRFDGTISNIAFNPDATLLVVSHTAAPYLTIYSRAGAVFTKLTGLPAFPAGAGAAAFSTDGTMLVIKQTASPYIAVYGVADKAFTKWPDTATPPSLSNIREFAFSPDGSCLAMALIDAPYVEMFSIKGTTLAKLPPPSILPSQPVSGQGRSVAFDPDGSTLAVCMSGFPYIALYSRNGNVFTKLADPTPPLSGSTAGYHVRFNTDGKYLVLGLSGFSPGGNPPLVFFKRTGNVFNQVAQNITMPDWSTAHISFSANGNYMAVTAANVTGNSPLIRIYTQTYNPATQFAVPRIQVGANTYIKT